LTTRGVVSLPDILSTTFSSGRDSQVHPLKTQSHFAIARSRILQDGSRLELRHLFPISHSLSLWYLFCTAGSRRQGWALDRAIDTVSVRFVARRSFVHFRKFSFSAWSVASNLFGFIQQLRYPLASFLPPATGDQTIPALRFASSNSTLIDSLSRRRCLIFFPWVEPRCPLLTSHLVFSAISISPIYSACSGLFFPPATSEDMRVAKHLFCCSRCASP